MNSSDILKYGNLTFLGELNTIPEAEWGRGGVCGVWSVKDIVAHLASYEQMLVDLLNSLIDPTRLTPTLAHYFKGAVFNDEEVAQRSKMGGAEVLAEYRGAYEQTQKLIKEIPLAVQDQEGILAWYGAEYDLQDFLVYSFYGHKREHGAQIGVFRDLLKAEAGK